MRGTPLDILRGRLAKGEVDKEEYGERKRLVLDKLVHQAP